MGNMTHAEVEAKAIQLAKSEGFQWLELSAKQRGSFAKRILPESTWEIEAVLRNNEGMITTMPWSKSSTRFDAIYSVASILSHADDEYVTLVGVNVRLREGE